MDDTQRSRVSETIGMVMIGDGLLAMLAPDRHVRLWKDGPRRYRRVAESLLDRPNLTRALGAFEIGLGIWWALKQEPD